MLMQLQRNQVIESSTEDDHDDIWNEDRERIFDIYAQEDEGDDIDKKRADGIGYVSVTLQKFFDKKNREITKFDRKLLKGFYVREEENTYEDAIKKKGGFIIETANPDLQRFFFNLTAAKQRRR